MRKLIKFKPSAKTYYDIADQKYADGDFENAIHYFYQSFIKFEDIDSLIALGETYCEIGEPEEGLKYLHMALDLDPDDVEICHSIAQCFIDMGDEETALFYFQPGISIESFRYMLDEGEQSHKSIRMLEKNDDMVVSIAIKLLDGGDMTYAREILLTVKPDSDYYVSANNLLALSSLELKKPEEAIEFAKKALSVKENIDSRCNMMLAYHMMNDSENTNKLTTFIEDAKADLAGHKTVSLAYIRINDAEKAASHLRVVLDQEKYNRDALVSYALANYNLNKNEEAKRLIIKASRLYPADIVIKELALSISCGEKLTLFPLLGSDKAGAYLQEIDDKLAAAKENPTLDFYQDKSFRDKICWLFQSTLSVRQSRAAMILGRSEKWRNFFCEQLLDNYLDLSVKKMCLLAQLFRGETAEIGIVIEGMYSRLKVKFPANMDSIFYSAYCISFASFAFSDSDFENRLISTARKLLKKYNLKQNAELIKNEDALAAAIFYVAKHKRINDTLSCAHLFGCEHDELCKYLKCFGIKTDKE